MATRVSWVREGYLDMVLTETPVCLDLGDDYGDMNEGGLSQFDHSICWWCNAGTTGFGWTNQFDWKHKTCGSQR